MDIIAGQHVHVHGLGTTGREGAADCRVVRDVSALWRWSGKGVRPPCLTPNALFADALDGHRPLDQRPARPRRLRQHPCLGDGPSDRGDQPPLAARGEQRGHVPAGRRLSRRRLVSPRWRREALRPVSGRRPKVEATRTKPAESMQSAEGVGREGRKSRQY